MIFSSAFREDAKLRVGSVVANEKEARRKDIFVVGGVIDASLLRD